MRGTLFLAGVDGDDLGIIPAYAGNTCRFFIDTVSMGIIPAYAGNTGDSYHWQRRIRDHPRVCGEHMLLYENRPSGTGSSPRMRGTLGFRRGGVIHRGIIPAYAGNTQRSLTFLINYRDHPRVCGEHITPNPFANAVLGSSPRMRGTPKPDGLRRHPAGIIPAYAGNTRSANAADGPRMDHPRVCGEH